MEKNNFAGTPDVRLADRKAERKRKVYMAITRVILYVLMTVIAACMILPFLWGSLITSLRPEEEIMKLPMQWIPSRLTLEHYKYVFEPTFFQYVSEQRDRNRCGHVHKPVFRLSGGIRLFQDKIQRAQDRVQHHADVHDDPRRDHLDPYVLRAAALSAGGRPTTFSDREA